MSRTEPLVSRETHAIVASGFQTLMPIPATTETRLAEVLAATLAHPGSLTRAQLAYQILIEHGGDHDRALTMATAIEYDHTASLLLDDLPCMDDALERRGHLCAHHLHGDAAAILAALALINRAYALMWQSLLGLSPERATRAGSLIEACLGTAGVINGQSKDVHFSSGLRNAHRVAEIAVEKTGALFRLTLVLPAIVAGIDDDGLERLERLSAGWGLAYQIIDDFTDVLGKATEAGKTVDRDRDKRPNMVRCLGLDGARARVTNVLEGCAANLAALDDRDAWWFLHRLQDRLETRIRDLEPEVMAA